MTSNKPVKIARTRPTVSQIDPRWEEKQTRSRKLGKVGRKQARQNKRQFEYEI